MQHTGKFFRYIPPLILVISLLWVYLNSLAPGLTWANFGADGGDLVTAAATGGVAHPSGYPVYLLLARIFQLLPIGSLAYRTNLMSALAAVAAALLVYATVIRSSLASTESRHWLAGLAAAYAFGLSPLVWSQAVITEVYTLNALFIILILYFLCDDSLLPAKQKRSDRRLGLTFSLAIGNHVTTLLILPILFSSLFFHKSNSGIPSLLRRLTWLTVGLLAYLTLPLRSLSQPPVNWGNPVTLDGFVWLVSGKLYQDQFFVLGLPALWSRVQTVAAMLIEQFGIPGLMIGLIGLVLFYKSSSLYRNTIWIVFINVVFVILYATQDSFMYLIPAFLCFSIWIGLGLIGLSELFAQRFHYIGNAVGFILILFFFILAGNHWYQVDASRDSRAEQFGKEVLIKAPENAIVFAKGDKAIFTMWYFHYALHNRPDLVVVATDLLSFDWYRETLLMNYKNLILPGPFPFVETVIAANPERPVCYIEYIQSSKVRCLPAKDH